MKTITEFLVKKHQQQTGFSRQELMHDLKGLDDLSLAEKKALNFKYDVGSNKWEDIQIAICKLLQGTRQNMKEKEFKDEDLRHFNHLTKGGVPQPYNKFKEYVKDESLEFLKFFKAHYENILDKKTVRGMTLLQWAKSNALGRYFNYTVSYADKRMIDFYNNAVKYIEENE